jgi:putative ABC transport system permease protein
MGDWEFYAHILELFAGVALLLAVVGIYGVMSYFVSRRRHEIGIRVALGARAADVLVMVVNLGLKLSLIGIAIGAGLALGLARLISTFLFGVKPTDPGTYAEVAAALLGVAMLACFIPARRATKVDPMVALRHE